MNMNIFRLLGGKTEILDLSRRIRFFCFDFCFFIFVLRGESVRRNGIESDDGLYNRLLRL